MLLSALTMGAILLTVTVAGFDGLFYERAANVAQENSEKAFSAATGCMEYALNTLGRAPGYLGDGTSQIDRQTCTVLPIESVGGTWTIKTTATVQRQTARILVTLSSRAPIVISSWQEGAGF